MFAQPMVLGGAREKRVALGALIAAIAVMFAGLFGVISAYAQTDDGNNNAGAITNPLPDTTINLDTHNGGPNLPNTGAGDVGTPDRNTWLILAVIVVAVALMIVGWGMGAKNGPTVVDRQL